MKLSEYLHDFRKSRGMTQVELLEYVQSYGNISKTTLWALEYNIDPQRARKNRQRAKGKLVRPWVLDNSTVEVINKAFGVKVNPRTHELEDLK